MKNFNLIEYINSSDSDSVKNDDSWETKLLCLIFKDKMIVLVGRAIKMLVTVLTSRFFMNKTLLVSIG